MAGWALTSITKRLSWLPPLSEMSSYLRPRLFSFSSMTGFFPLAVNMGPWVRTWVVKRSIIIHLFKNIFVALFVSAQWTVWIHFRSLNHSKCQILNHFKLKKCTPMTSHNMFPHLQCVGTVRGVCWVIASVWWCLALPLAVRLFVGTHGVQVWVETCRVAHCLENLNREDDDTVKSRQMANKRH